MTKRVTAVFVSFVLVMIALGARIYCVGAGEYAAAGASNSTLTLTVAEARGNIYDCSMNKLVNTESVFYAVSKPSAAALSALGEVLDEKELEKISERFARGFPVSVRVDEPISVLDDLRSFPVCVRYAENSIARHLIGYVSDGVGVSGIEKAFDALLNDKSRKCTASFTVDAGGRVLSGGDVTVIDTTETSAAGVCLTLDKDIQRVAENALGCTGIKKGACVVIEIATGEIKAMVSVPAFDPNNVAESLKSKDAPFLNRAMSAFSVGSVFKPVVAAAALESGIAPETEIFCSGSTVAGGVTFNCHAAEGHGSLEMKEAMVCSCNVYFIELAKRLDREILLSTAQTLGFGEAWELCGGIIGAAGVLPTVEELDSDAALANLAFGQGSLLASPLQLTVVMAAIAGEGLVRKPMLVKGLVGVHGELYDLPEPSVPVRAMSDTTAHMLSDFLIATALGGTGALAMPPNTTAGGKTATAQTGSFSEDGEILRTWFSGFFPAEAPKYAVTVVNEEGESGYYDCAPVFAKIAEGIISVKALS